jgi:flagellar operon protein
VTERISIGQLYPSSIPPASTRRAPVQTPALQSERHSFRNIMQDQLVRFSHHAETRLEQRGIQLQPEQLTKIGSAIDQAAAKGAKDSLMLMGSVALIVNIPNRTVVTALDGNSMKDNVFTKIDSAVVIS